MVAIIAALIAVIVFFLPWISATEEYREYMDTRATKQVLSSVDLAISDMKNMSIFTYAKVYILGGNEVFGAASIGYFIGGIYACVGVFALFTLLSALGKRPILTFFNNVVMGIAFYIVNWDIIDRHIMPDSNRVWGISYYLYYPLAAIIAIAAIWMFVAKRKMKKNA